MVGGKWIKLKKRVERDFELAFRLCEDGEAGGLQILIARSKGIAKMSDEHGWTLLHRACVFGHLDCIATLLAAQADPNAKDLRRLTPVHNAAMSNENGVAALHLLLRAGGAINDRDSDWRSPVMLAAQYSNLLNVVFLIGRWARLDFCDRYRRNVLAIARHGLEGLSEEAYPEQVAELGSMIRILAAIID